MPKTKKTAKGKLSPTSRARIVAALKARWAARKAAAKAKPSAGTGTARRGSKATRRGGDKEKRSPSPARPVSPSSAGRYGQQYRTEEASLPIAALVSDLNYRTHMDEAPLGELVDSIREHGILERLWVRPMDKPTGKHTHEIIAGGRRYQAALQTTLLEAPVKIFHCSRAEALALSLIENLQRENPDAIDEAFGFQRLMNECGFAADDDEQPEKSIRHQTGKSRTYVYAALKLCELPKLGHQAIRSGELSTSVGTRIARLGNPEQRMQALKTAIAARWTDDEAAAHIARDYQCELKGAPFDREDPTLNPERPSCERCPFRSGNQAKMFPDLAGRADMCLDTACFRGKVEAAFAKRADAHEEKGGKVLSGPEAEAAGIHTWGNQIGGKYTTLDRSYLGSTRLQKPIGKLLKKAIEEDPTLLTLAKARDGSGETVELVELADVQRLLKAQGIETKSGDSGGSGDAYARQQREHKAAAERGKAITRWQLGMIAGKAQQWTAGHIGGEARETPHIRLLAAIADWLVERTGVDALRLVCVRRQINPKDFQLDADLDTPARRMQAGLRAFLKTGSNADTVGLLAELMAAPGYARQDGDLDDDQAAPIAALLDLKLDALHVTARTAIDDELKEKLGKKKGTLL